MFMNLLLYVSHLLVLNNYLITMLIMHSGVIIIISSQSI